MGGFDFRRDGVRRVLSRPAQRVCALLALKGRALHRTDVAGTLWPDLTDERASANLRQILWRVSTLHPDVLDVAGSELSLSERVAVDVNDVVTRAQRLLMTPHEDLADGELEPWRFRSELWPNAADHWLIPFREELRSLQASALEALCHAALRRGRVAIAIASGRYTVDADPLRESGWRCLIEATIEHGNLAEAIRLYRAYAQLLAAETGLDPSPRFTALLGRLWQPDGSTRNSSRRGVDSVVGLQTSSAAVLRHVGSHTSPETEGLQRDPPGCRRMMNTAIDSRT